MCYTTPIVAFPSDKKGIIQVYNIDANKTTSEIKAAESHVAFVCLNEDGTLLATASEKGTLIRVFDLKNEGKLRKEVRRGSDRAEIYHLAFDNTGGFVTCSSDKGTVHIFGVGECEAGKSALKSIGAYFKGERSFAKFRMVGKAPKCAISDDKKLVVITKDGMYYVVEVDWTKGGESNMLDKKPLINDEVSDKKDK